MLGATEVPLAFPRETERAAASVRAGTKEFNLILLTIYSRRAFDVNESYVRERKRAKDRQVRACGFAVRSVEYII